MRQRKHFLFDSITLCAILEKTNQKTMPEIDQDLTTRERINLFLEKVKQEELMFDCPHRANKHLRDCLNEIEDKYAIRGRMSVTSLKHFEHEKDYKFYHHKTPAHFVIIHQNGTYAIFNKRETDSLIKDLFFYKEQTPIVEIKSKTGAGLWADFEESVMRQTKMQL